MFFLEIYEIFGTAILRNYTFFCLSSQPTLLISLIISKFVELDTCRGIFPFLKSKMQFLVKIDRESRGIFRTQQNIKMELFAEKVNSFWSFMFIIFVKSAILCSKYVLNTDYCFEYVSGSVNYFRKEPYLRCLTWF